MNDKNLKALAMWIGGALLIFYAMFDFLIGIALGLEIVLYEFLTADAAHIIGQFLYGIFYFVSFSVPAFLLCHVNKKREGYRPISFKAKLPKHTVFIIIAVIAINYVIAYFNSMIFLPFLQTYNELSDQSLLYPISPAVQIVMMIFTTAIVPAICEELLFRGAILTNLTPYGRGVSILFSAFLFGLMHQNVFQIVYTMILGVILGYVYVKTKSLLCCMLIHFFNNLFSVIQDAFALVLEETLADIVIIIMNIAIVSIGVLAIVFFVKKISSQNDFSNRGSFGVICEPNSDYEELPITKGKKFKYLFSPTVIIFVVLASFLMVATLLTIFGGVF